MITGSCLCGQLHYELDETQAGEALNCHCTDCRKVTGSGKATVVTIPLDAIELHGEYKTYEKLGTDGSHVGRGFCPDCGSQMLTFVKELDGFVFVKAGTMDDSEWVKPVANCWVPSSCSWSPADETLTGFAANPDA
jgi:hypothetical protein